ncbi:MAG: oligosaccharide flippase family protein [Patescibacteria group bacterium]
MIIFMLNTGLEKIGQFLQTDAHYLFKGSSWLGMSQAIAALASFGAAVAFANLLPPNDYGTYKYVLGVMGVLAVTTLPELSTVVVQTSAKGATGTLIPALIARVRFSFIGVLLGLGIAGYYAFQGNIELTIPFLIVALALPIIEPLATTQGVFVGKRLFKEAAIYTSVTAVASAVGVIVVLLFTDNVWMVLLAYLLATLVSRFFRLRQVWKIAKQEKVDYDALKFGMHLSFSVAIAGVAANADSLILWHMTNPETLAVYAFAVATLTPARTFLKTLVNLAHPKIAVANHETLQGNLLGRITRSWFILLLPVALFITIMPFIYEIFFPRYMEAVPLAQVMALGLIFTPNKLLSVALIARQKAGPLYHVGIWASGARIILFVTLVPLFGIWGAVFATLLSQTFSGLVTYIFFKRKIS